MNQQSAASQRPGSLWIAQDLHLHKKSDGTLLSQNIQRWNSCQVKESPSLHRRKVLGRPQSTPTSNETTFPFTPDVQSPSRHPVVSEDDPISSPPPLQLPMVPTTHSPHQQRSSPRRFKSDGWLDLPSLEEKRGLAMPVPESPKPSHSPVRSSPRRVLSLEIDVRKRLVRTGQSVRSIEPEPEDLRAALAKKGQSVRGIRVNSEDLLDEKPTTATTQPIATGDLDVAVEDARQEEQPTAKTDVPEAPSLRMGSSASNIPFLEPLVEEDSERNESEEFHALSIPVSQTRPTIATVDEPSNEEEEESMDDQTVPTKNEKRTTSDAFAKRSRASTPNTTRNVTGATTRGNNANSQSSGRQSKMGLMSRLSMRFSIKGPLHQRSTRKMLGKKSMSCRNPSEQVFTGCYGPTVMAPSSTLDITTGTPTKHQKPEPKEISLPAITVEQAQNSAVTTSSPKTNRMAMPLSSNSPATLRVQTPPPKTSRPVQLANDSSDPKDVVFSPPTRMKSFDISFSSTRRSPIASDSSSGSPPVSPMKSIARSPSRSSPRRRMSRTFLSRQSIRSILSQRSITTNNAVSDGIYPRKGVTDSKSPRHRLVARLSFRLSQSDLKADENGCPAALRTTSAPSNLQEKQEERRNLLTRMARHRDADSRTAEMSITHTRQMSHVDNEEGDDVDQEQDEPCDDHDQGDDMRLRYVPETVAFHPEADEVESAITDACTWVESIGDSLYSPSAAKTFPAEMKLPPCEIQAENDNVSCLQDHSGSFRVLDQVERISRAASDNHLLDNSLLLNDVIGSNHDDDENNDDGINVHKNNNADDEVNDKEISVDLVHVSPGRREYPKMMSLKAKTVVNLENSDGSLYLDDPTNRSGPSEKEEVIPGDTMDENFYLAEIIKALEEQNRKTKAILKRKARSKPAEKHLVEL